ncbi:MAG TPA: hypothetical protein PLK76_00735 [bacterium]|nr:hypothetical protein [bacterium]
MKYVISILGLIIGFFLVIKTEWMIRNFGYSEWAETKFAMWGGSRMAYKLGGIIIIIVSIMWATGWAQDILVAIFTPGKRIGIE